MTEGTGRHPTEGSAPGRIRRRRLALASIAATTLLATLAATVASGASAPKLEAQQPHGIVPPRGAGHARSNNVLLLWHNGAIMNSADVKAIFWGQSWSSYVGDKISGIDQFYSGVGGSSYLNTNTEYTGTNGQAGTGVTYGGHAIDSASSGSKPPTTADVLAVVARNVANPVANGYYPVYSDLPRGSAGYCAWHSYGTIGSVPVQFAFFFKLDGDPGCDPGAPTYGHSQGLSALANVSGHELSEALTDPRSGGWYDRSGQENADKCAWTFSGNAVTFAGTSWKIQGNFSNAAYSSGSGYDHAGCIDTK